jgi:hypothetical protein
VLRAPDSNAVGLGPGQRAQLAAQVCLIGAAGRRSEHGETCRPRAAADQRQHSLQPRHALKAFGP